MIINQILVERRKDIEREHRIEQAQRHKRRKFTGTDNEQKVENERDISEKIALGQQVQPTKPSVEAMFDQRLFNQNDTCKK